MPIPPIQAYYDALAPDYDRDRFGNSYGRYIHALERDVLADLLQGVSPTVVADVGGGTGRMLEFAHTGIDASIQMLAVARTKWLDRRLLHAFSVERR